MKTKNWKIALSVGLPYAVFMIITGAILDDGFTLTRLISSILGGIFFGFTFTFQISSSKLFEVPRIKYASGQAGWMVALRASNLGYLENLIGFNKADLPCQIQLF